MAIHGLPVMNHTPWVLAHQVGGQLGDRHGAGLGTPFQDGLSQTDQPLIRVYLQEQPARFDQKGFQTGYFHGLSPVIPLF